MNNIINTNYLGDDITLERTNFCIWIGANEEWNRVYADISTDLDRQFIRNEHGKFIPIKSVHIRKIGTIL